MTIVIIKAPNHVGMPKLSWNVEPDPANILVFFLFGIAVTMIAGSGSTFQESFGIPTWLGALIMTIVIYLTFYTPKYTCFINSTVNFI
jgi:uncharacterized membrane protein YkvI